MDYRLFFIPLFCSLAAWLANKMLVSMIFHPVKTKNLFGLHLQGIFPQKQEAIALQLGTLAGRAFQSLGSLDQKINDPAALQKVMPTIEAHVDNFLRVRLKEEIPMISMFVGDKTIASFKKVFMQEIETLFPEVIRQFTGNLQQDFNIEKLVSERVRSMSPELLEQTIKRAGANEFRMAGFVSALIGLIIGFAGLGIALLF